VILAALVMFLAILATWANEQALNTDEWTKTSSELLEDEQIRTAVATYLVDELYANVDVAAELRRVLPGDAQRLAGPAAGGLREFAQRAAVRVLASPRVQEAWEDANRQAHRQLLDVIEDKGELVTTSNGEVFLDLRPLVERVGDRVGIGGNLSEKLPPNAGKLAILRANQLEAAQTGVNLIQNLAIVLPLLWLALWALAMYLAIGRRREALKAIGIGMIVAGVAVLILRGFGGDQVTDALASNAAVRPAAEDTWTIGTSLLTEITQSVIAVGLLLVIGAWLAGPTRPAVAFRRAAAPFMRERAGLTYGVVAAIFLILVVWAPVRAFTRPLPLLVIAVFMLLGTEALRRQAAREFPDAQLPEGGIREAIRGKASGARSAVSRGAPADPHEARLKSLERLNALKEQGALSQEEFEAQKAAILRS
jgi:hypothetical protein